MTGADFQKQSLRRKFVYFGIILVLFSLALGLRKTSGYGLDDQAGKLAIRDQDLGDGDLTAQAVRLSLLGSRGVTVCALWAAANEKQKKHEWTELELIVRSLTKLQPHFIAPWRFQSWNLAYNVSVESDRVKDKYFFITRGIDLAAEGERNNFNNPDLRWDVGYFFQDKIGIADESNTLRCLFQLSCIDPLERQPSRFRSPGSDQVDNMVEFRDFCERHPMLVRRLRETLRCKTPEDVVDFLEANQKVPSRFEDAAASVQETTPLKSENDRFPPLPKEMSTYGSRWNELTANSPSSQMDDSLDNYAVARSWFCYAQDPLNDQDHPRKPKQVAKVIFEGYPSRAQHYLAERMEKEGWFDDTGWEIRDWQFPADKLQPLGQIQRITVGKSRDWAVEAWEMAYQMTKYRGDTAEPPLTLDPKEAEKLDPVVRHIYNINANLTNFQHFYVLSRVERTKPAVTAKRLFHEAEGFEGLGDYEQAKPLFEDERAFGPPSTWDSPKTGWKRIFLDNKDYAEEDQVQEETYIYQHKYKHSLQELNGPLYKQLVVLTDGLGQSALWGSSLPLGLPVPWYSPCIQIHRRLHAQLQGPFDGLIGPEAISTARDTLGLMNIAPQQDMGPEMRQKMMERMRQRRESKGAQ